MQLLHWCRPHAIPKTHTSTQSNTHTHTHTHTQARSVWATSLPPSLWSHSGSVMIWKLQYSSQQFPLSLSRLSCAPRPRFPQLSDKSCTSCSISPPPPTPPCQVRLSWLWTPRRHILLNTLLVDAGSLHNAWRWAHALEMWALVRGGQRRRMERKYKKRWGGAGVCFSLCFGGLHGSRCYLALSVLVHARCKRKKKKKSMSVLRDSLSRIRALWVLLSSMYLTVAHWLVFSYQQVCLILFFFCFVFFVRYSLNQCEVFDHQELKVWQLVVLSTSLPHPNCCFILLWHFSPA